MRKYLVLFLSLVVLCMMATPSSLRAGQMERSGAGLNIWLDVGGPVGGPYAQLLYNGAQAAANDLGCDLTLYFSDWSQEKMIVNFKKALASHPDGIAINGYPGDDAFMPLIDEAYSKGIAVTSLDTALSRTAKKYQSRGFGYAGVELYSAGRMLGEEAVSRFKLGQGNKAMVWGLKGAGERGLETVGIIEAMEAAGVKVDYIEITPEIDTDPTLGVPVITGYLTANPDCNIVLVDHGGLTAQLGNFFRAAQVKPDDIIGAGFSLSPAIVSDIKAGYIDLVSDVQPYMQAYYAVVQLVMTIKHGFAGFTINTAGGFVHQDNIDQVAGRVEKGVR